MNPRFCRVIAILGLFWAGLCPSLTAAPPEVPDKPIEAKVGELVTFDIKVEKGKQVGMLTLFDKTQCSLVRLFSDDENTLSFMAQPKAKGQYFIATWTVGDKTGKPIQINAGTPDPVPDDGGQDGKPKPKPQPDPGPKGEVKFFVVVEDTSKAGQFRGDVLGSEKVQAYYKQAGLRHLLLSTQAAGPGGEVLHDGVEKAFIDRAKAKGFQYYLALLDAHANILGEQEAPIDPDKFVEAIGGAPHQRAMGNNPPPDDKLKLKWVQFGDAPNVPMIPRSQWKPTSLKNYLPPVHDQDGRGQCNCSATCTAVEAAREIAGMSYVYLSAGDLYSQINGGRDDGSLLEDGLAAMMNSGVATAAKVPYVWDGRRHTDAATLAERKNYMVLEAYVCPNFDAMASALQQGFVIIEGLMWYNNFTPDSQGWLPAQGRGGAGGHALCGYGIEQRNGVWGIRTRNSWGARWGVGGDCVIPESLFGKGIGGFWAVRAVSRTPADGFPTPKFAAGPKVDQFRRDIQQAVAAKVGGAAVYDASQNFPVLKP